jgi:predicted small lipoprotein YifL
MIRKLWSLVIAIVVVLTFAACGQKEQVEEPQTQQPPATAPGGGQGSGQAMPNSPGEMPPPPR